MKRIAGMPKRGRQQILILFLVGFALGILLTNLWLGNAMVSGGIMSRWFLTQFFYTDIEFSHLFWYVLEKRMKTFCLLVILGFTSAGTVVVFGFLLWLGISIGAFFSICIMQTGIMGILLALASFFPQFLMYIPVFLLLLWMIENRKGALSGMREEKQRNIRFAAALVLAMMALLLGICMESYLNPFLLKRVIGFL
ncbi:MAG: stage II sporulation protein M [Lachnospiraceae bacterium]|nr:stage II sporulation protein M [Lachnospiraceae bacterium]